MEESRPWYGPTSSWISVASSVGVVPKSSASSAMFSMAAPATQHQGPSEQALDRYQSATYLQGDCSYRRANEAEEEEGMRRRWSVTNTDNPCGGGGGASTSLE